MSWTLFILGMIACWFYCTVIWTYIHYYKVVNLKRPFDISCILAPIFISLFPVINIVLALEGTVFLLSTIQKKLFGCSISQYINNKINERLSKNE